VAVDAPRRVYVADAENSRIQKFVPRKDADKSRSMTKEFRFKTP
jgi:hypothetical protein